ncbi:hypothetical protein EVA_07162 [gut metagenome]|uniref:Uncharacterized protein n=1 Tax=gut metagenome TaxID=749906 RepID=J9GBN7_9ZZZZ
MKRLIQLVKIIGILRSLRGNRYLGRDDFVFFNINCWLLTRGRRVCPVHNFPKVIRF